MNIEDFQLLMKELFFESDTQRGIHRTSLWLVEEIGELIRELKKPVSDMDYSSIKEEMADVFAWLCSIANLLNISIEEAVQKKYPGFCIKCGKNPCDCKKN